MMTPARVSTFRTRPHASMPLILLRLEGLAVLMAAVTLYHDQSFSWWRFALLFLTPDLSFAGFAFSKPVGSISYNLAHTLALALLLAVAGVVAGASLGVQLGLIWAAHIGMDRALGFGLLYPHGSNESHFSRV